MWGLGRGGAAAVARPRRDSLRSWAPRGRPPGLMGGGREDDRRGPQLKKIDKIN